VNCVLLSFGLICPFLLIGWGVTPERPLVANVRGDRQAQGGTRVVSPLFPSRSRENPPDAAARFLQCLPRPCWRKPSNQFLRERLSSNGLRKTAYPLLFPSTGRRFFRPPPFFFSVCARYFHSTRSVGGEEITPPTRHCPRLGIAVPKVGLFPFKRTSLPRRDHEISFWWRGVVNVRLNYSSPGPPTPCETARRTSLSQYPFRPPKAEPFARITRIGRSFCAETPFYSRKHPSEVLLHTSATPP